MTAPVIMQESERTISETARNLRRTVWRPFSLLEFKFLTDRIAKQPRRCRTLSHF
jgi:hypothetical protein